MLQMGDCRFAPGAEVQAAAKPALLLSFRPLLPQLSAGRQNHVLHPHGFGLAFVPC
jgi:hypothetical protein